MGENGKETGGGGSQKVSDGGDQLVNAVAVATEGSGFVAVGAIPTVTDVEVAGIENENDDASALAIVTDGEAVETMGENDRGASVNGNGNGNDARCTGCHWQLSDGRTTKPWPWGLATTNWLRSMRAAASPVMPSYG